MGDFKIPFARRPIQALLLSSVGDGFAMTTDDTDFDKTEHIPDLYVAHLIITLSVCDHSSSTFAIMLLHNLTAIIRRHM